MNTDVEEKMEVVEDILVESTAIEELSPRQEEQELLFDPSYLEKMTFGDQDQFNLILDRFLTDCLNDRKELLECLATGDIAQLSLLLHRLAGRLAQMGSRNLGMEFRLMEIKINQQVAAQLPVDASQSKKVHRLCEKLEQLTRVVAQKKQVH